jgi:ADP-dependent NAD(P)H-hydrate dehydratase / NAD(P)H-hydrate epimerase
MKILSASQIREADAYTIRNEPISSVDLMERAARALSDWLTNKYSNKSRIRIFCGPGNNGGDGLALCRLLIGRGYKPDIYLLKTGSGYSHDTSINLERLRAINTEPVILTSEEDIPGIDPDDIVVDALFGTGLDRPVHGLPARLIEIINNSGAGIVAIDIPSGLFGDDNRQNNGNQIIKASYTLSFQFPKLAFMFAENHIYTGSWEILPIGLHEGFTGKVNTQWNLTDPELIKSIYRPRDKFSHKGHFGHCLLISGSYGRMGAAVLAARSCLRSGTGLLTVHVPAKGCEILQVAIPEAMVSIDPSSTCFSELPPPGPYNAIAAGPALGTLPESQKAFYRLLKANNKPLILDADAINIIALNKGWLDMVPEESVITPHPGEFDRLAGQHSNSHDRLINQIEMAKQYKINIVLKGAHTSVALSNGSCFFNSTGNPGMATAGSGDVLTGIILSLLGQGYRPADSAIAGVYLHGLAGDFASEERSAESVIAGDITQNLGKAFKLLKR